LEDVSDELVRQRSSEIVMFPSRQERPRAWLAPGLPIIVSFAFVGWATYAFATAVHGYVAAYINPLVMIAAAVFVVMGLASILFRRTRPFGVGAVIGGVVMIPLYLAAVSVLYATGGVRWRYKEQVSFGSEVRASLVLYLEAGASDEQVDSVWECLSSRDRRHMPLPGIASICRVTPVDGHEAIAVSLMRSASKEEISAIRSRLGQCEHVYRILEDVVPADVERLD
jgi:hypothetical protein